MKTPSILLSIVALILLAAGAQTHSATPAGELQLGINAYKINQYDDAIQHFQKAVDMDGSNLTARLYLATACVDQYIPGVDSKDNLQMAERAIEQYQHVLDDDTERTPRISSAKGIGYLYLNMKKFDDAKKYYHIASDLDPNDPEPYYSVGVIDWTESYQPRMEERAKLGMKPEEHLDPANKDQRTVCDELKVRNAAIIEEGIEALQKAIKLRPDYDDAMAYLNLMYREKADLECDNLAARAEDLETADNWVDNTLAVKKAKANTAATVAAPSRQ